ncbi:aminoglycoside phosphotransferase family protein (plasmid) [Streptomyces sp. NBC_01387]|uniref:aminoglycoside phosphotransferase family protein n=1 Tax=unclassified Streptomyces TaxID=2593676 RepID=UPI00225C252C|nr:aminoglycoside phosphotransferase family protein [Streptomyces sp. NBC_01500]MCX4554514.1 aminoglycoside phosphotransferase family protein [Streptomyces sp. NBC_01500]
MRTGTMHAEEFDIDVPLVRRLIAAQFPQWAGLPVTLVDSAGTSNAMYRLGADMVVRLPRIAGAASDVEKEQRWLPWLAPQLPVAVPLPLGKGMPAEGYPWHWSVYCWIEGVNPAVGRIAEPGLLAQDLAEFCAALHRIDPADGSPSFRSEPLATRDASTRGAIAELHEIVDTDAATAVWEAGLQGSVRPGPKVWIHSDLQPGNLLVVEGRLSAVIDFGCLGLGDPAVDLIAAWYVLPAEARGVFRAALGADDGAWARGRGWALSTALSELRYYRDTNPVMAAIARHVIHEVLTEHGRGGRRGDGDAHAG